MYSRSIIRRSSQSSSAGPNLTIHWRTVTRRPVSLWAENPWSASHELRLSSDDPG